jgi:8-oxo-dGTP pyrophosphatase MutT (NUDIX family)
MEILAFEHPCAGFQLVKGSIEIGETPSKAAIRELHEEAGITHCEVVADLGIWEARFRGQVWSFHLGSVGEPLPERWLHRTEDGGGQHFRFFCTR